MKKLLGAIISLFKKVLETKLLQIILKFNQGERINPRINVKSVNASQHMLEL